MPYTYFAQFIPGTEEIVAGLLRQRLKDLEIVSLSSGAGVFSTAVPYSSLNLFCFNNLFRVLYKGKAQPTPAGTEGFLRSLPSSPADWPAARENPAGHRTFRLMVSCKNQLIAVSRPARSALEKKLAAETRLRLDRSLPDSEFLVLVRADGSAYFLKRLTRHRAYDKLLHPGELHPELAYMLCWLTGPKPTDVVADPFCGYGSIPLQRAKRFPFASLLASDQNPEALAYARRQLGARPHVAIEQRDALHLGLPPESLDAIITDPPWGLYGDQDLELPDFYQRMLGEFARLLRPGGRAVLLTAAKRELAQALENTATLRLVQRHDILVSGKKAAIFLLYKD